MDRIDTGTEESDKEDRLFNIRAKIRARYEDFQKAVLIITGGDVIQKEALLKGTIGNYLYKLDYYATQIENVEKRSNVVKNPGLLKKTR